MYSAEVSTPARRVSIETPFQLVSCLDHFVTQWMSVSMVSAGRARNSGHGQETGSLTTPSIMKLHSSSGVWGVGPAERTGKSVVQYWPGGSRDGSPVGRRRPMKPRETGDI